ncbi:hypothetical protein BJ322DRAFT_1113113 [Thelephora terrestris]|uniref:Uncharacterized protein n=1 Tax=Thelephora terrestris TaxID=56493 RepID=A0A9P6L2W5_9AGAM|nr:hypothetical protein BJ322DRAFT_1113113 [Thelephora terrestris]
MFSKVALSTLAVGAISANALAVPVARSPAPQPESWSEWGTNIGNYYSNKYGSPSDVPGLPQFKREPETWGEWGSNIGNYYANKYGSPSDVPGLPQFKREPSPEPESWEEWGTNIGNYYANKYSTPDSVPGLPQYKRSPSPETWGQWGSNIGNYYANKYGSPDQVSGLPRPWLNNKREPSTPSTQVKKPAPTQVKVPSAANDNSYALAAKREPESWEEWGTNIGNYYANQYGSPSDVPGLPQFKREPSPPTQVKKPTPTQVKVPSAANDESYALAAKREPETWEEWGTNVGNYYANQYGSPSDVPGLPQYKREPSPEPETWEEWGTNIGNYYSNKYSTPDSVPGLPHY